MQTNKISQTKKKTRRKSEIYVMMIDDDLQDTDVSKGDFELR